MLDSAIVEAAVGYEHNCFRLANGNVECSGNNIYGQANGRRQGDAVQITAGADHTCVLLVSGNVDCFGRNDHGESRDYLGGDAVAVAAGSFHTCIVLASGNVKCGGQNDHGQANDWKGGHAVAVDLTTYASCALLDTGNVVCWGVDFWPFYRYDGGDAVAIGGGDQHTCVVLSSGNVHCFGTGGSTSMQPYLGGDAVAVDAGYGHTCILTVAGNVLCHGGNANDRGYCGAGVEWAPMPIVACEGLDLFADRPYSRTDGAVVGIAVSVYNWRTCYVLADGGADCQGGFMPMVDPRTEPTDARVVTLNEKRFVATSGPVEVKPQGLHVAPDVHVPVRVCLAPAPCVGKFDVAPGTVADETTPGVCLSENVVVTVAIEDFRIGFDPQNPIPSVRVDPFADAHADPPC